MIWILAGSHKLCIQLTSLQKKRKLPINFAVLSSSCAKIERFGRSLLFRSCFRLPIEGDCHSKHSVLAQKVSRGIFCGNSMHTERVSSKKFVLHISVLMHCHKETRRFRRMTVVFTSCTSPSRREKSCATHFLASWTFIAYFYRVDAAVSIKGNFLPFPTLIIYCFSVAFFLLLKKFILIYN